MVTATLRHGFKPSITEGSYGVSRRVDTSRSLLSTLRQASTPETPSNRLRAQSSPTLDTLPVGHLRAPLRPI